MRRTIAAVLALLLVSAPSFAFDTRPTVKRVAVVAADRAMESDERMVRNTVAGEFVAQLRRRGFEAYETAEALEGEADFIVEIVGGEPVSSEYGSVGVNNGSAGLGLGILVSRVAADIHVYDGATLELLSTDHLYRRSSAVVPTGLGVESGPFFAFVALPFVERARARRVARLATRDAVPGVIATINGE